MNRQRLEQAHLKACRDLIAERDDSGVWTGRLSDSALSTATAISALAMVDRERAGNCQFAERIDLAVQQLIAWQNDDGGWGDTDRSFSNLATTMLVRAAFHLAGRAGGEHAEVMRRAEAYIEQESGIPGLRRRFGKDKTFAVPILTNCAIAGLVDWSEVASLPFELACLPFDRLKWLRLPVVSYAVPALVAIGQAGYFHRKPKNPAVRWIRQKAVEPSLRVLQRMQPDSGGFLEATPLTSFVVMSLASIGQVDHPVVQRGVEFLCRSQRESAGWPIDEDLSTWVTTLAINALPLDLLLEPENSEPSKVSPVACDGFDEPPQNTSQARRLTSLVQVLLDRQQTEIHPFTDAAPGGWGWTGLSGAVPDVDDTAGALLALHHLRTKGHKKGWLADTDKLDQQIVEAASAGIDWLLSVQNRDGGWPTFCKGWGTMPFDRSTVDLTSHVLRALKAWQEAGPGKEAVASLSGLKITKAIDAGFNYLGKTQRADGSWSPLWFGNQHHEHEENPIFGTARVLLAYRDHDGRAKLPLSRNDSTPAAQQELRPTDSASPYQTEVQRAVTWLVAQQNSDGGWGGNLNNQSTTEETAAVLTALLGGWTQTDCGDSIKQGLNWLIAAVESDDYRRAAPIGLYFSRLWYYERLYPLIFAVGALNAAIEGDLR